jgi:hypothetical protein
VTVRHENHDLTLFDPPAQSRLRQGAFQDLLHSHISQCKPNSLLEPGLEVGSFESQGNPHEVAQAPQDIATGPDWLLELDQFLG